MSSYGAMFCRGVEPFLANLKALLAAADAQGVGDWPAIASARAVYEDIDGFIVYAPWAGDDCARHQKEVQAAINRVNIVLNAIPGYNGTAVPRPDATPQTSDLFAVPTWVKFAGFGVLGIAALHYLTPYFTPRRRLSGHRRRR